MSRTIAEIKKSMTDAFLRDNNLRKAYDIKDNAVWDNTFSSVSVENILIYIVASCAYVLEKMFEAYRVDIDELVSANIVPTVRWYYTKAKEFQLGDALVYDEKTFGYKYHNIDPTKQVIKYAAVQDKGNTINVLVAGDVGGHPSVLPPDTLSAFNAYMNQIKIAGILLLVKSLPADKIKISVRVFVNPLLLDAGGTRISDGKKSVVDGINTYLANIVYGGTFNKTKCVDAIQQVEGVIDVELLEVSVMPDSSDTYRVLKTNNCTAEGGAFVSVDLDKTIEYVV